MITMYKWDNPALQQIWKTLYAHNSYVFPYSSWEYNEQIYESKTIDNMPKELFFSL